MCIVEVVNKAIRKFDTVEEESDLHDFYGRHKLFYEIYGCVLYL